jgi:hypothetical protein
MMNIRSINVDDHNPLGLFEQVLGQMVEQSIQTRLLTKHQVVILLEDMIQQVERGTLTSSLDTV